ncbi:hypothetical protein HID58_088517 [Brassica napus]|uniref:Uncharacterized protein n=1 Tax=Brassica napus TaxID=3708 RepID=A0ABQ7XWJ0_BRANA|nr:hypothetical protein HID58_088517 [Brassica napus]
MSNTQLHGRSYNSQNTVLTDGRVLTKYGTNYEIKKEIKKIMLPGCIFRTSLTN